MESYELLRRAVVSELGAAIGRFRRMAGLTQAQLADAAGLSVGLVRGLEEGL